MTPIVIDASAGVEMVLRTEIGRMLRAQIPASATLWAPGHYFSEVGAVLRRLEVNGQQPPARIQQSLDVVLSQPVQRVSIRPLMSEAWTMRHNLTFADALYVVVAQHLDAPIVTADERLARSPRLPVATITPSS